MTDTATDLTESDHVTVEYTKDTLVTDRAIDLKLTTALLNIQS